MWLERVALTGLEVGGRPVRIRSAELVRARAAAPGDPQSDWIIFGTAWGPLPDRTRMPVVAIAGSRRFSGTGLVMGAPVRAWQQFKINGGDGRELVETAF